MKLLLHLFQFPEGRWDFSGRCRLVTIIKSLTCLGRNLASVSQHFFFPLVNVFIAFSKHVISQFIWEGNI